MILNNACAPPPPIFTRALPWSHWRLQDRTLTCYPLPHTNPHFEISGFWYRLLPNSSVDLSLSFSLSLSLYLFLSLILSVLSSIYFRDSFFFFLLWYILRIYQYRKNSTFEKRLHDKSTNRTFCHYDRVYYIEKFCLLHSLKFLRVISYGNS